jgi:hypothetical protein
VPPIDPNTLPKDTDVLRKIVVDLCEQLRHESSEKNKYQSLSSEVLENQLPVLAWRKDDFLEGVDVCCFTDSARAPEPRRADVRPAFH